MKRRIAVLAAVFALAVGMLGGCGNNAQPAADSTKPILPEKELLFVSCVFIFFTHPQLILLTCGISVA